MTSDATHTPTADENDATPKRRGVPARLARGVAGFLWLCLAVAAAWSLFAWLYPQNLRASGRLVQLLDAVGFAGQVLRFHLAVACGAAVLLALLVLRWKLAIAAAVVGVLLATPTLLTWLPKTPPPAAGPTLRVQSINLLAFNYHADEILAAVAAADADVIAVQEYNDWHDAYVAPRLAVDYPYSLRLPDADTAGMAIFSRRPIVERTPAGRYERQGWYAARSLRAVVEHDGRRVAVWDVHPASPGGLGSFVMGRRQTADLIDGLRAEPLPHVVAGDFNAATGTANLQAMLDSGLDEVQAAAGVGPGWTWPRQRRGRILKWFAKLPGLRIDQCFFSPELTATRAAVGPYHGSDHLGVIADLAWRK